jgi:hypothetical protein
VCDDSCSTASATSAWFTALAAADAVAAQQHGAQLAADVSDEEYSPEKDPALQVCRAPRCTCVSARFWVQHMKQFTDRNVIVFATARRGIWIVASCLCIEPPYHLCIEPPYHLGVLACMAMEMVHNLSVMSG